MNDILETLIARARDYGATQADAIGVHGFAQAVSVRGGALEDVETSEGSDIGLRVLVGAKQACVSSSDLSPAALDRLAERCVAMAKTAPDDPYAGLAEEALLSHRRDAAGLDLVDDTALTPEQLKERALAVEAAALSVKGVRQAEGAQASLATSSVNFVTSHGFSGGWSSTRHGLSVSAVAERDSAMERDYDSDGQRHFSDLKDPEAIGCEAGQRAVARLGSAPMASGAMPILFDRRVSSALIAALLSAINGAAVARGVSFLKDRAGETLFPKTTRIFEDPLRQRGLASRPFDGEGVTTKETDIVSNGVLNGFLLNSAAARQLGGQTSGHAVRGVGGPPGIGTSNVALAPGTMSRESLIAETGRGMLVSEMFGPSLNPTTGDWSVGVSGFEIEGGQIGAPVSEVTIAGNLIDVFASLTPADDLIWEFATNAPTLRAEGLTLAGR